MRYYGQKHIGHVTFLRYEGVANQYAYSLPLSFSNSTFKTRADILYLNEGSGSITVTECQSNLDLVGFTYQPGIAYVPEDVFGNNTVRLQCDDTIPVLNTIIFNRRQLDQVVNNYPVDVNTVTVNGSFTIPANTYAAVVEGTITVSNTVVDSNADLYILGKRDEERAISGDGKIITFRIA